MLKMYFPKQILVLLIWVPIVVQSQNPERCNGDNTRQCVDWANKGECQRNVVFMQNKCRKSCNLCRNVITGGCNAHSQCRTGEYCNQGSCVDDPCSRVRCPSTCQVVQGQAQCDDDPCSRVRCATPCRVIQGEAQCDPPPERCNGDNTRECVDMANRGECERSRDYMQTNCRKSCNLCNNVVTECTDNSQCGNSGICDRGTCVVHPCVAVNCGTNKRCVALGDGQVQCQPIPGIVIADPCAAVRCGTSTRCVALRGGQVECQPIPGCIADSQCSNNGICDSGRCVVNPCSTTSCGTNNKCIVVRGEVQCQPLQESHSLDRDNNQGVGANGNTQGSSQGGSNSGSSQGGNQASVTQGGNPQGSATHGANQHGSAQDGNQVDTTHEGCNDNSHCNIKEVCEKMKCVSPCDLIDCAQGASCNVIVNEKGATPKCICPPGTTGHPSVQCEPIQGSTVNDKTQPSPGSDRPVAPVSSCRINSQCGTNERCQSERCVNPCALFVCGEGAKCQVSQRQPQCVCPEGTEGNPREGCKLKTAICPGGCGQGKCTGPNRCTCNQGYSGSACTAPICPGGCGQGDCTGPNRCTCKQGYSGSACTSRTSTDISFPEGSNQTQPVQVPGKGTRLPGCEIVPDAGECRGAFPRYYFNKAKDQCDCFLFGGCDEERVKFTWPTFEECLNKCVPMNTTKGSGCKRVSVDEVKEFLEQQRRDRENNGR